MNASSAATLSVTEAKVLDMNAELRKAQNMIPADRLAGLKQLDEAFDALNLVLSSFHGRAPDTVPMLLELSGKLRAYTKACL